MLRKTITAIGITLFALSMITNAAESDGGIGLEQTRLVIKDGKKRAAVGVRNTSNSPVLVATRIETLDGRLSESFEVTPSLYQLRPGRVGKNTIFQVSELPSDRESVFFITVITSPPDAHKGNKLSIALGQRIKMFYRPKGIDIGTGDAAEKLIWSINNGRLTVTNNSPVSVSLESLSFNNEKSTVDNIVLAFSSVEFPYTFKNIESDDKKFSYIDEWGNVIARSFILNK